MRTSALIVLSLALFAASASRAEEPIELSHASFALSPSALIQPDDAIHLPSFTTVILPDSWPRRDMPSKGYGWYRIEIPRMQTNAASWGYIPRAAANAQIFFNGVMVWSGGVMTPHPQQTWSRSILFPLSNRLFKSDHNELQILLGVDGNEPGLLGPVYIGDQEQLRRWAERRDFLQRDGYFITSGILFATGCYLLLLWTRAKQERRYAYLGFGSLVWSLRLIEELVNSGNVEAPLTEALELLAISATPTALCLFNLFVLELIPKNINMNRELAARAMWTILIGSAITVWASYFVRVNPYIVLSFWMCIGFPLGVYLEFHLVRGALRKHDEPLMLAAVMGVIWYTASFYDNFVTTQRLPGHWIYLAPYTGVLMFTCFAVLTIGRFSRVSYQYQMLSVDLEQRVADRQRKIELQYEELIKSERQRTVLEERDRMVRDLHDGLGSQLVGAIHEVRSAMSDPQQIEDVLARCLDELRIAIESIDPETGQLPTMLGALRYRMERRLQAANIALTWEVEDVPRLAHLDPSRIVNILRLLQEAFTNTLKHANATSIALRLRELTDVVELQYEDNGSGFTKESAARGYGMENMRRRAQAAVVLFDIQSSGDGTLISLRLPITS